MYLLLSMSGRKLNWIELNYIELNSQPTGLTSWSGWASTRPATSLPLLNSLAVAGPALFTFLHRVFFNVAGRARFCPSLPAPAPSYQPTLLPFSTLLTEKKILTLRKISHCSMLELETIPTGRYPSDLFSFLSEPAGSCKGRRLVLAATGRGCDERGASQPCRWWRRLQLAHGATRREASRTLLF